MRLALENVTKKFGDLVAVDNLNLEINEGEIVSLLGPSGCGKTTTLNMIAGFERPTSGNVLFNGKNVNNVHPRERNVGMVFQEYAIFTTMNAYQNIAFGLLVRGVPRKVIDSQVRDIAATLNLTEALYRNINKLNLSELQRVALARTLSTKPSLLLLDEPLSNLDAALRERTRVELKRFHDKWGITMVYVTHDQIEAISLANRIAVMRLGRVEQYDFADVIYRQPASIFVAQFIGNPPSNIVNGEIAQVDGRYYFQNHNLRVDISKHRTAIERHTKGSRIALGFRPEDVLITKTKPSKNDIGSEVFNIELLGYETILDLKIGEIGIKALVSSDFITSVGETVYWGLPIEKLNLYDSVTGENMIYTRA